MQIKKFMIIYIILLLSFSSALSITVTSQEKSPPWWDKNWSYNQEIILPIETNTPYAKNQPIDTFVSLEHPCWAKDISENSIRVVCWDGNQWHELESQIYDIEYAETNCICKCGLVFLIPDVANGNEKYFVYYDDKEKPAPNYIDHISIEDAYYYYEPISGISVEGDYYNIMEDGYCVYGVGQRGEILGRKLSQVIVRLKPKTTEFDTVSSEVVTSFAFSFNEGPDDKDEVSSDQVLISKEISIDGNLMIEFGLKSKSSDGRILTSNVYKYYYSPTINKRFCVHVKHEITEECKVKGEVNVDGRFGAMASYKSTSARIQKMRFGDILPYLNVYGENKNIREYKMNPDPEGKEKQWIISYSDDCDVGEESWISYGEGKKGRIHGVIFSSNTGIVKSGKNENDGISIKVGQKEYFDFAGSEVDYAAINFGRNSYEKSTGHDLTIPKDMIVEFDAEFFSSEEGDYNDVSGEAKIYRTLIQHRQKDGGFEGDENIHILTVIPRLTGRILSWPSLSKKFAFLPSIEVDLYKDNKLFSSGTISKPLIGAPRFKFPKLSPGCYGVKVFLNNSRGERRFIGFEPVGIYGDKEVNVLCTWEKNFKVTYNDQNGNSIKYIDLKIITGNNTVVIENTTDNSGVVDFGIPYSLKTPYYLRAYYKGFLVYDKKLLMKQKNADINIEVYDLNARIRDTLGMSPGVDVRPVLTSQEMANPIDITPIELSPGEYLFEKLPCANYELQISYGGVLDKKTIKIPENQNMVDMSFTATFDLNLDLFNSRGEKITDSNKKIDVVREGKTVYDSELPTKTFNLPPAKYTINVYSDGKLVALKTVDLIGNRKEKIVTIIESITPTIITVLAIIFIFESIVILLAKKISLNTFLKITAMAIILISLVQPWWGLYGASDNNTVSKSSEMFLVPQTMIDKVVYKNTPFLDVSTIPDLFTNFLVVLLIIVCSGLALLGLSFIPNIVLKRRFSMALVIASIIFLVLVLIAFYFGMHLITEVTLGSLTGEGIIDVKIPNGDTIYVHSNWGFGNGFYLCVVAALTAMLAGILDYFRRDGWPKRIKK